MFVFYDKSNGKLTNMFQITGFLLVNNTFTHNVLQAQKHTTLV